MKAIQVNQVGGPRRSGNCGVAHSAAQGKRSGHKARGIGRQLHRCLFPRRPLQISAPVCAWTRRRRHGDRRRLQRERYKGRRSRRLDRHYGLNAEYAAVPADRLIKIPEGVSDQQAAATMLQGMTAHYLCHDTFPVKRGQTALVHAAAGGVGRRWCRCCTISGRA